MSTDPELSVDSNGTATLLTGINYRDLRSILTAGSLHRHANPPKANPLGHGYTDVVHENNLENSRWHLETRFIIDVLESHCVKHALCA